MRAKASGNSGRRRRSPRASSVARAKITGRLQRARERLVSRDRRGIDRPVPQEALAQDVDRVLRLVVREVGLGELEEDVGGTRVGRRDPRAGGPTPCPGARSQGVPRRIEAPAGPEEERNRLVEPALLLEDPRRLDELPGGAVQRDRPLPLAGGSL